VQRQRPDGIRHFAKYGVFELDHRTATLPAIMPWWDDLHTGTNGNVRYQLLGTSPNRKLVVEWNVRNLGESGNFTKTVQVWLFESSFAIQFVYGTGTAGSSASVGIATSATEYQSVTTSSNTASTTTTNNTLTSFPAAGRFYLFSLNTCTSTPSPGTTLASVNPVCNGSNVTLSLSTTPSALGISFRWQTSPDNITWTNVAGTTGSNPTLVAAPTTATWYRCLVTCTNSGLSSNSIPLLVNVSTCLNMQNGIFTNICSARIYDSGGPGAVYASSENYTLTLYPSPGNLLRVQFVSFNTESGYDFLTIFNGNSTAAPQLLNTSGTTLPGTYTSSAIDGSLTFRFTSDGSITYAGWEALLHSGLSTGIDTFTVGTAPNRKFVVRYNAGAVAFYNVGSQTGNLGGKIVLHESTGVVEVRIATMNKGVRVDNQTHGIENAAGTAAVTPPGKNNLDWTQSTPRTYRFTPTARQCNNSGITFT
jgi:hypothetical protein